MTERLCKVVSKHAEDLSSGRVVAPGDVFPESALDHDSDHDQRLIEEGGIVCYDAPDGQSQSEPESGGITPEASELAEELDVDLEDVQGTGLGGRILVSDVEKAAAESQEVSE